VTVRPTAVGARYLFVGATCAVLHNVIVIGFDRVGVGYAISSLVSFVVVVTVGYLMHTAITFRAPRSMSSFVRYAVALAANYPLIVALLFVMVTLRGIPVPIAAPAGTVILFVWNFIASRWAIVRHGKPAAGAATTGATDGAATTTASAGIAAAAAVSDGEPPSERVVEVLAERVALYRHRRPVYQIVLLQSLRGLWNPADQRLLDVGGGTGLIGQAIHDLFPIGRIASVDVEDRFLPDLSIETATFDGSRLPFDDAAFDCALLSNVLHHVPEAARVGLMLECSRATGGGRIYVKDHLATGRLDRIRLAVLDYIGNTPFHGMVKGTYLDAGQWAELAKAAGYRVESTVSGQYRSGPVAMVFPNRLEIVMRWVKTG
jgi:putative flippase GtrA/SAM-dependent methyltransferase